MPFCVGASWLSIEHRVKEYFVAFLVSTPSLNRIVSVSQAWVSTSWNCEVAVS
jgi:hypothetical protein